jgi:hypothetical protein
MDHTRLFSGRAWLPPWYAVERTELPAGLMVSGKAISVRRRPVSDFCTFQKHRNLL